MFELPFNNRLRPRPSGTKFGVGEGGGGLIKCQRCELLEGSGNMLQWENFRNKPSVTKLFSILI